MNVVLSLGCPCRNLHISLGSSSYPIPHAKRPLPSPCKSPSMLHFSHTQKPSLRRTTCVARPHMMQRGSARRIISLHYMPHPLCFHNLFYLCGSMQEIIQLSTKPEMDNFFVHHHLARPQIILGKCCSPSFITKSRRLLKCTKKGWTQRNFTWRCGHNPLKACTTEIKDNTSNFHDDNFNFVIGFFRWCDWLEGKASKNTNPFHSIWSTNIPTDRPIQYYTP